MKYALSFIAGMLFAAYIGHNRDRVSELEGRLRDKERAEKAEAKNQEGAQHA